MFIFLLYVPKDKSLIVFDGLSSPCFFISLFTTGFINEINSGDWYPVPSKNTLDTFGFKIIEGIEDHNYIQFRSIEGIYSYFKKVSPDLCDVVRYKGFYMSALKQIKENHVYRLSTYDFLVVAQNEM